ncbi:MAG: thiamine pyrophosphate-dependent enzyme [bacterium]|nr:thiamine pyrophosphate-dependent enzyme [bacterium]
MTRPDSASLTGKDPHEVPMSLQRIAATANPGERFWIGPDDAKPLSPEEVSQYEIAHTIIRHLAVMAPLTHKSGHPGGPLSAFTLCYWVYKMRSPDIDQPLRMSPGHLSVLAYGLIYLFGRDKGDERLRHPQKIIDTFRTPSGLPGHIEAGIGDIPFGTGPLGKAVSHGLGTAFGLKHQNKPGVVDVLLADGDSQEGQVQEAFRLAAHLQLDNLIVHGDWNDIQLSGVPTETVAADFAAIAAASGWNVIEVQNGNNPSQVKAAIEKANTLVGNGKPIFICYYTTMGHGIALMEEGSNTGSKNFHGSPLSKDEATEALKDLEPLDEAVEHYQKFYTAEQKRYGEIGDALPVKTDIELIPNLKGYKRSVMTEKGAARKEFGALHLLNMMKVDDRIMVLHADLAGSGGFDTVGKEFPDRCVNVGVAEANMYMMAAGMRQTGLLPVTYTFAAFGTNEARANARLIDVNCGHTRCGIINDCTHAGLSVGEDGETHQERHYLNIPFDNTEVWMSADSNQAAAMAEKAIEKICEGHVSIYTFFPRDGHEQFTSPNGEIIYGDDYAFDGKIDLIRGKGTVEDDITVIATGIPVHSAVAAAEFLLTNELSKDLSVRVLNVSCIRPIDSATIIQAALETGHLIVVEDHNSEGGLATQVADIIADFALPCSLRRLGANHYFPSAPAKDLYLMAGIDSDSIADAIQDEVRSEVCGGEDAFVSCIYQLTKNMTQSRFSETAKSFADRLISEHGYINILREYWADRECPPEELPSNTDLTDRISDSLTR